MTDALPSDFIADGQPFENPEASADTAYAATVPSLGAKLGADFGDGITAALGRAAQRGQQAGASFFDRLAATPDVDTAAGMVVGGQDPYPVPAPSPTISPDDANKRFAPPGTTITDGPITEDLARVVGKQKADEVQRESVLSRYAAGHGTLTNLGVGLALSPLMDPVGSAAFFVPGIGEEAVAARLGTGAVARTTARAVAGASAGAAGMGVIGAAKYALGTEQNADYSIRDAMYDMAGGAALGALGHAGFGALREAGVLKPDGLMEAERSRAAAGLPSVDAPTGLVSGQDLGAVVDAPATARFDALHAGVAQVLDGRQVDVAPIFDQVRADRAEADLQRWTAQQARLDAQSTSALRASSAADAAAGTIESRAGVLQKRLDDLHGQHAGFLADIEAAEGRRAAQVDTVTPERLGAIDAELVDNTIPAARRADLENERALLTDGRDPAADALEAARTDAELQGLQRGAAAVQTEIDSAATKVAPLQDRAAAGRQAGSDALQAASDRIAPQEEMVRSLAARSIRRYAGAFDVPVTRDEADALAARAIRGGPAETARVVAEIRGRAVQAAPVGSPAASPARTVPILAGPPIEQQRAAIAADVIRNLTAAGRPLAEAKVNASLVAAHYEGRASRFGGALGTAEQLYRDRAPEIRGPEDDAAPVPMPGRDGGGTGGAAAAPDIRDRAPIAGDPARAAAPAAETPPVDADARALPDATKSGGETQAEPEIAPDEPATPRPEAVEQIAAEVMPEAVEPVHAAVEARGEAEAATAPGAPRSLSPYAPEADAPAAPRGKDQPAGVFMFDPLALAVDPDRFQFKSGGDAYGVTGALRSVTQWDPAKAQSVMVWEQADGRLFVADGHQRAGLARRLTEGGQAGGIELPGVLYRERDGISADDARAIAAVTNIANGSGSALDGAKVLRARPDLLDGSVPLSAGKGDQAAALARLGDEAFRMVVNDVVPENFGAVVGQMLPRDEARQVAALKAIARFEPRSVEEATALTQRVASAELARADAGAQGSLFGDLEAPESTAGEEMRIVGRVVRDLRRDRGLFARVVANAGRLEQAGSTIARDAARSAGTDAGAFAKVLASDAYTAGPTRSALVEAAKDLRDGRTTIGDAAARLHAAVRRQAEEDGPDRLGARLGDAAPEADRLGVEGVGLSPADGDAGRGGPGPDGAAAGAGIGAGIDPTGGARSPAAGTARGGIDDGASAESAGGAGRAGRQGRQDAPTRARRGGRRAAARDGDALGRLIGDDNASRVVPLHDGILDRGTDGEASLVDQMNDLLGRRPTAAPATPRRVESADDLLARISRGIDEAQPGREVGAESALPKASTAAARLMDRSTYRGEYPGDAAVADLVGIPLRSDVMASSAGEAVRGRLLAVWRAGQDGRFDQAFASAIRELRATFNLDVSRGGIEQGPDGRPRVVSPNEVMLRDLRRDAQSGSAGAAPLGVAGNHPDLIPSGDHVIRRLADDDGVRRYDVHPTPAGVLEGVDPNSLGERIASAILSRHPDGRWEVGLVKVDEAHRRQGIARKLYAAIEGDMGITMRPSGHLLPDGYAMWQGLDPEAVRWHTNVEGDYLSPRKLLETANEVPGEEGAEYRAAFDALPPEARTPEALRTMFQRRLETDVASRATIRDAIEAADRGEAVSPGERTLFQRRTDDRKLPIMMSPEGDVPASRGLFTRQSAVEMVEHFDRLARELDASGDTARAAERRATAEAFRASLPEFDKLPDLPKPASRRSELSMDFDIGVQKFRLTLSQANDYIMRLSRRIESLQRNGGKAEDIADAEVGLAGFKAAVPKLEEAEATREPYDPSKPGRPFAKAKVMESGRHAVSVATDERHGAMDEYKTYRVFAKPDGAADVSSLAARDLGRSLGRVDIKQNPDGRWEVAMVEVRPSARGKGVAKDLYAAVERDLGITMKPSGQLLADGYEMWKRRDPESIKLHTDVDGQFWSPKMILKEATENAGTGYGREMQARFDALPPESKTPEALATMFQTDGSGAKGPLGSITFRPDDRPLVRLMRGADASTFIHEMGHDWLEQMMRDAEHPAAPEAFRADATTVRGWLGNDGGELTEAQHEKFARWIEQYLREGVAPSPELAGAFAQFRGWLMQIYKTMRGLGAEISPDIRGVLDRLLTPEPKPSVAPARPDVAALARQQQAVYRAGFAPGMPQAEFDALNATVYGAKAPGKGEVRAAAPATSTARAGDTEGTRAAGTPARTAAEATLAAWQQRFEAAGVVPSAEERALLDDTAARLKAADLAADGYAQAGECLTAAGI